jgi:hypothetical protein
VRLLGFDDIGKDISCSLVISVPRFGEAQAARGAVKKAGSEPVFERADPPADHRFREAQSARGTRETLGLDCSHEDRHVVKEAHPRPFTRRSKRETPGAVDRRRINSSH